MVAVTIMGMVELAVDEVVGVVAMGNCFMAAAGPVGMAGAGWAGCAAGRVGGRDRDGRFVDVIAVGRVEMAVVEVGNFVSDADGGMATALAMNVGVAAVDGVIGAHAWLPSF